MSFKTKTNYIQSKKQSFHLINKINFSVRKINVDDDIDGNHHNIKIRMNTNL